MKKIFILLSLFACIVPQISHAQVDQRCWTEDACYDARKSLFGQATPEKGKPGWEKVFRQDDTTEKLCGLRQDAVGTKVGFCLPATTAKIKISIGGQNEFAGLGEFVAFIYKYGMGIAGILSVLMIIFAGVQWIVSAGSSEAISSAKHRITGAVIGLIILATAYTILYTINPDLVNLRPPNAWMINTQKISAPYCGQITKGQISKDPSNDTGTALTTKQKQDGFNAVVAAASWAPTSTAQCGKDYFVQSTGALTCSGSFCNPEPGTDRPQACFDKYNTGKVGCYPTNITGKIYNSNTLANVVAGGGTLVNVVSTLFGEGWEWEWANQPVVEVVCNNGEHNRVAAVVNDPVHEFGKDDQHGQYQVYRFNIEDSDIQAAVDWCETASSEKKGVKGFVLNLDLNREGNLVDETHFVGRPTQNSPITDLGDEDNELSACFFRNIPAENFLSAEDIGLKASNGTVRGTVLDIDVNKIIELAPTGADYSGSKTGKTAENRKAAASASIGGYSFAIKNEEKCF